MLREKMLARIAATADDHETYRAMLRGEDVDLPHGYIFARQGEGAALMAAYNALPEKDFAARTEMLSEILGANGGGVILSPVTWEYGRHIEIGQGTFVNFDCLFLDAAPIRIGDLTAVGPRVMFLTTGHPLRAEERYRRDPDTGEFIGVVNTQAAIDIGKECWIGAGAIILAGVTIGDGTTVGAGSVVTKSLPAGVLAAGNPARVIRKLSQD